MPTFEYQAQNGAGEIVSGVVFGVSLDHAARDLASQGLKVTQIGIAVNPNDPLAGFAASRPGQASAAPVPATATSGVSAYRPPGGSERAAVASDSTTSSRTQQAPPTEERTYAETSVWGPLVGQVPLDKLYFFFKQLGTMLNSGVPIVQSLNTLAGQARHSKLEGIIREIRGHVDAGRPMTAGLQRYPEVFTPIMVSLVRAGEEGGFLSMAVAQIANYLEKEIALRNLYKKLTLWPKIELFSSIAIIIVANAVIDQVKPDARHLSSPLTTASTWIWLGPLIVGIFLFLKLGLANPRVKFNWDTFATNVPGIGTMLRELSAAKFGRAFGALYKGGVPLQKAMQMAADACGNEYLRSKIYPAARRMEDGEGIAATFAASGAFSPIVLDMVATGERTGNLEEMVEKMAEFYEDEATVKATQVATYVGLLLFLCVAIYIGYIVITFYTGMGQEMHQNMSDSGWITFGEKPL
jgi:type II secretory pathway component PulF